MFEVANKQILAGDVKRLDIKAPLVAASAGAGQSVLIQPTANELPFAVPIVEADSNRKLISIIIDESDRSRRRLGQMQINDSVESVIGPIGEALNAYKTGNVACIGSGSGVAQILSVARALKQAGNKVYGVISAESKQKLVLEAQMRIATEKIWISTEDGSYQSKGTAGAGLKEVLDTAKISCIYAAGPISLLKEAAQLAEYKNIKLYFVLKPMDSCGLMKCRSCRIRVAEKNALICQDGSIFEADTVDLKFLEKKLLSYRQSADLGGGVQDGSAQQAKTFGKILSGLIKK